MEFKAREIIFILVLGILITSLGLCSNIRGKSSANIDNSPIPSDIFVHVSGYVHNPGVYKLASDSRVTDAITAAGGALEEADIHRLNLAAFVIDGQKINVPRATTESTPQGGIENGLVNINTADQKTLETLTGIGPVRAASIIEYRETKGGFSSIEEIMNVSGIGEGIFESLREQITH